MSGLLFTSVKQKICRNVQIRFFSSNSNDINNKGLKFTTQAATSTSTATTKEKTSFLQGVTIVDNRASAEKALEVLNSLKCSDPLRDHACDTEVVEIDLKHESPVGHGRVFCASIYCGPDVDFGNGPKLWIDNLHGAESEGVLKMFKPYFEDNEIKKIWHNYSFDRHVLGNHDINVHGFGGDTLHMARLWDAGRIKYSGGYSLESLSNSLLSTKKISMKERFARPKIKKDGTAGKLNVLPDLIELQKDPMTRDEWIHYCVYDAECTWNLKQVLVQKLKDMGWSKDKTMWNFYEVYWRPFGELLTDMEKVGFYCRKDHLKGAEQIALKDQRAAAELFLKWAIKQCPDAQFMNINSKAQIQQLLFAPVGESEDPYNTGLESIRTFQALNTDGFIAPGKKNPTKYRPFILSGLGIKPVSKTKTEKKPQVSETVLRKLCGKPFVNPPQYGKMYTHFGGDEGHEACVAIDALRKTSSIDTLLSNFIQPLQQMGDEKGRVHCSLNLNTETGRLSARCPNLQNQPALEKDVYKIRDAFSASKGNSLIVADYAQLELRVLAHMSNCQSMKKAFLAGGDFHSRTAMGMYPEIAEAVASKEVLLEWDTAAEGSAPAPLLKEVYHAERQKAKILNFSIAYGKTAVGLSRDWNVTVAEAKETLERWYLDRHEVRLWQEHAINQAKETGWTRTLMGRYRPLPSINSQQAYVRSQAERAAINTPIQGGAADIVMKAMLDIHNHQRLKELGWKLILQVHDEVILEGQSESSGEASAIVKHCMENPFKERLLLPLTVDLNVGQTWFQAK